MMALVDQPIAMVVNRQRRFQERIMMKSGLLSLFVAGAACAGMMAVTGVPARAEVEFAWCAIGGGQGGSQSCSFTTVEQCRSYVTGSGGFCQQNPRATAFAEMPKRNKRL
jgi:Protein of unknown function (DUF3551)